MQKYLEAGRIINKRGLKGELKVECLCDTPEILCSFKSFYFDKNGKDKRQVLSSKTYNGFSYLLLSGISTAEEADRSKGQILYIDREDYSLTEQKIFIADLIGLPVYNIDSGICYGTLSEIFNSGASDIYRIKSETNEYLIPAVSDIICKTDVEKGIFIRPIAGLLDDAEEIH